MKKIKDLIVGESTTIVLVVASATARETRAKKPYLNLEFFDGESTIYGNFWDWGGTNIPAKNAILDVVAQVTEYQGSKQLTIKALKTNTEHNLTDFAPVATRDLAEAYKEAYALAADVKDDFLRGLTLELLEILKDKWYTIPGAKGVHHAYIGGTLVHSVSVAKIAQAISRCIPESNDDLCTIGGLLHDIGKLFTYRVDGVSIDMTTEGQLFDHTFIGARLVSNMGDERAQSMSDNAKINILTHIILAHHGVLEFGAAVPPMCVEAHIVHHADGVDASTQQVVEQSKKHSEAKWTDRIYTLGNKPQLTTQYVGVVFDNEE